MRTLFLLLAFTASASAQTLKWDHSSGAPGFAHDSRTLSHLRGDAAGNVAFGVSYQSNMNGPVGVQVCWISAAGKVLHSDIIQGADLQDPRIVSVSPAVLIVQFSGSAGTTLRKYTRRGAVVTSKDTPLGNNFVTVDQALEVTDKLGFFVVKAAQNDQFLGVQRFTVR